MNDDIATLELENRVLYERTERLQSEVAALLKEVASLRDQVQVAQGLQVLEGPKV